MNIKPKVCLIIIDGWGIGQNNFTNPIFLAKTPYLDHLKQNYPYYGLQTSGIASGLSFLEEGSSEVGHLILGSGRTIYQTKTKIDLSIKNNEILKNKAILEAINHAKQNNTTLHLIGMISNADVIASYDHLRALIYMAKYYQVKEICLHLITDGKDGGHNEALQLIQKLNSEKTTLGEFSIGSVCGRFYALNNHNDEYLKKYFNFLINDPSQYLKFESITDIFNNLYNKNINDEFIEPMAFENAFKKIKNNDSIIMFNYKVNHFPMEFLAENILNPISGLNNVKIVSFVDLKALLKVQIAFQHEKINDCLSAILSYHQIRQVHLSESHKSLHVTYYFNGLNEKPFPGEYWFILPSKTLLKLQEDPYLEAKNITERAMQIIDEGVYDFLLINYANADLAGHTGDMELAKTVVGVIDSEMQKLIEHGLQNNFTFIITSDHGNIEKMKNPTTGEPEFGHDPSFVPVHLIANSWKYEKPINATEISNREKIATGVLADIAPTILDIFNINKPPSMTGHSIIQLLRLNK